MPDTSFVELAVLLGERKRQPVLHYLYMKKHEARDAGAGADEAGPAVFVANLPYDTTLDNVRDLCSALGGVVLERFEYQGSNRGLIRLVDEAARTRFLRKAEKLRDRGDSVQWDQYGPRGAQGYVVRHAARFPSETDLQDQVDAYMQAFAEREEAELAAAAAERETVDEDGFTKVVSTKRRILGDAAPAPARAGKRKKLEKADFYRFQIREARKGEMNELLRKYQEDKEKVEELKRKKLLRPY